MATWHQEQAMRRDQTPLWDEAKWTVINEHPGALMSCNRYDTAKEAAASALKFGGYVLPPAPIRRN